MAANTFTSWGDVDGLAIGPVPTARNAKDRVLQAFGATPDTNFPNGYLGTVTDRRENRMEATRSNTRSYARGVHKGERINMGDYFWPDEFGPMTGLKYEAAGLKFAPSGQAPEVLVNDGKVGPKGVPTVIDRPQLEIIDRERASRLKRLVPSWR